VDAYGCVDELNASLGLARVTASNPFLTDEIFAVQKELVIVMGELATSPEDLDRYVKDGFHLTSAAMTDRLTLVVEDLEKNRLGKFKGWAVPGKTLDSAALDLARTVCRRAERRVAGLLADAEKFNLEILRYLNRLSDVCWLLARYSEHLHDQGLSSEGKR
jgi:cob(I)alamin adenosyltransferase